MRILSPRALVLAGLLIPGALPTRASPVDAYQSRTFKLNASKSLPYRLFIPKDYDAAKAYPVILTLHGAGERGNDNRSQLNHLFTNMWADDSIQKEHPCFVIAPQCPANEWWVVSPTFGDYKYEQAPVTDNLKAALGILDAVEKEFHIDPDRQYLMGMSMGGAGTWYALVYAADRFAAAVPVCGRANSTDRDRSWLQSTAPQGVPVTGRSGGAARGTGPRSSQRPPARSPHRRERARAATAPRAAPP